ncbi:MAG: ATP-binding protein [Myxococcota bacterium]
MPLEATLVLTWSAVHGYVAAVFFGLALQDRRKREYLAYAAFNLTLSVLAGARAGELFAPDLESRRLGTLAVAVGLALCVPTFIAFAHELLRGGLRRVLSAAGVWCALVIAALVLGYLDPGALGHRPFDTATTLAVGFGWTLASAAHVAVFRAWRRAGTAPERRDYALLSLTALLIAPFALRDLAIRAGVHAGEPGLEHAVLLYVPAMCGMLLARLVRGKTALELRSAQLERRYATLRVQQAELAFREQLAAVGELSAVIAHEVRNPLAVLKNALSGLRREGLDAADRRTLHGILSEEVERLQQLMLDLLTYARPKEAKPTRVPLRALVETAFARARAGVGDGDGDEPATLELHVEAAVALHGDAERLLRALVNVLENALRAQEGRGRLFVTATREGAQVALRIRDEGPGMDERTRSRAASPFFTTRPRGTGLGLAIVERVARTHGGSLHIESTPGEGTTVTLRLPAEGAPTARGAA